jgi:DNA processing protein
MTDNLHYKIAISLIPGIGSITAKSLIAYTGSAEQVFHEKEKALRQIPGIGSVLAKNIVSSSVMSRAGTEVEFLQKNNVKALFYLDDGYPQRLLGCVDAPVILYVKGTPALNCPKVISIVGTRHATEYGKKMTELLITTLAERGYPVIVISGLAYGIDIQAHKSALRNGLPTVAVMGHGLETVYPALHTAFAKEMIDNQGGIPGDILKE